MLFSLFLAVLPSHARVFWRWGGRAETGRVLEALGAKRAYSAPVVLNGGRGSLSVYGLDLPLGTALRRIGKSLDVDFNVTAEMSMVIRTIDTASGHLRLIAIAPPDLTRTLVFLFEQSGAEAARSSGRLSPVAIPHVPVFPGSDPFFVATDEKAQADLAISSTRAAPEGVMDFYDQHLTAGGWMPALPGVAQRAKTGIYLRGRSICCVQTSERNGETHITVFHKELSNKPSP